MEDYWEKRYRNEGMIWGSAPSQTTYHAIDIFRKHNIKTILVPGSGYGRNTKAFSSIFQVDGIELSKDAVEIAMNWDQDTHFMQGSILSSIGRGKKYDAIYCFDLLHLFLSPERNILISNCIQKLNHPSLMYFTCFSDEDKNNGIGREIEEGTYEYKRNKFAHFFSEEDLREHFRGLEVIETGSTIETLHYRDNQNSEYTLRYIIVKN
ncbi:MAG: class I SAM-dependent methyltransferase [Bacillota bacterium]